MSNRFSVAEVVARVQAHASSRHAARELEARNAVLETIIAASPYAVAMFDTELRYLYLSPRWLADHARHHSAHELLGRKLYEASPHMYEHCRHAHQRCLAGESPSGQAEIFGEDGQLTWVRWEMRAWRDARGSVGGIIIFFEDASKARHGDADVPREILELRAASEALRDSESRFRGTFENAAVGIAHVGLDGRWLRVNDKLCSITGYTRETLLNGSFQDITHPDDLAADLAYVQQMIAGTIRTYSMEKRYIRSSGEVVWINLTVSLGRKPDGTPDYFISIVEDIDRRKSAERALRESERSRERARFFELSVDMVCIASKEGHFSHVNPAFSTTLGYAVAELIGHSFLEFVHPDERTPTRETLDRLAQGAPSVDFTNRYRRKDGCYSWLQWRVAPEVDGRIYAVARDVSADRLMLAELRDKQASLSASLKEREVLLQEVHHRVKNNLQVISSLIGLQLRLLQHGPAIESLEECRRRIDAMALIHETLYRARDYARVPFAEYARSLASSVLQASARPDVAVEFEFQELTLTVDRAIPSGLILNELMTNALKHAFPGEKSGTIRVLLSRSHTHMELAVVDDGVGLPGELDPTNTETLGMQLVTMLVEQLEGELEVRSEHGASFRVRCALDA
jgi:PAS domain S-box-containing protein